MRVEAAASWEGPRLFLSGAGGPFPDFSFATLFTEPRKRVHGRCLSETRHKSPVKRRPSRRPESSSFAIAINVNDNAKVDDLTVEYIKDSWIRSMWILIIQSAVMEISRPNLLSCMLPFKCALIYCQYQSSDRLFLYIVFYISALILTSLLRHYFFLFSPFYSCIFI